MRPRSVTTAAPIVAALAACATPDVPPTISLDGRACVAEPELGAARPLELDADKPLTVEFDATAACLEQDGTRSTYVAFRLPETTEPYLVTVESAPLGKTLLAPRLLLLDAEGNIRRARDRQAFMFHGATLHAGLRRHPGERFLVVASDAPAVGQEVAQIVGSTNQTMVPAGPAFVMIHSGKESRNTYVYAHNGRVTVAAQPVPKVN